MYKILTLLIIVWCLLSSQSMSQNIQSPEDMFGFKMGTDRKLIDWTQIVEYFTYLDGQSDKIIAKELGKTTLGKPFILSIISSAQNIKNLEQYKKIQQQIANPYNLSKKEATSLVENGKIVILLSLNIHSTEIGSSQESVELAYELVTGANPNITKILDNVIILLIPSVNPDGQQMVVDWYKENLGTPYEGCRMPWLYHHYAGHDNNRDWFMFNLQESRLAAQILYHEWYPEIVYDQHQMGSTGPRMFIPPYSDPVNPNIHSTCMAEVNMLGKHVVADLHQQGFKGVVTGMAFNAFFEGTMSKTPLWHNMIGILSEMASARIASPIYLPRGSLGKYGAERPLYSRVTDFLDPWQGGWWRLRDIIEYEKAATYSILDLAAIYKNKFMMNFYTMNKEAIEKGKNESPYAYIIPRDQHDPSSASEMLKKLQLNGVKIYNSKTQFTYDDRNFPKNTFIIPLSQPCRPCIKDLLECQVYPNLKRYPDGPPKPPYDVTGWTMPLQMGVEVIKVKTPLNNKIVEVKDFNFTKQGTPISTAKAYLVERRFNNSFAIINILLSDRKSVYWTDQSFAVKNKNYPAGTFIIPDQVGILPLLQDYSKKLNVPVQKIDNSISIKGSKVKLPRLAIYQPWLANKDEGWTRLVLDNYWFSYNNLHNDDLQKKEFISNYDVIIIPDLTISEIIDGKRRKDEKPIIGRTMKPEKYQGGIGDDGAENLTEFINSGGTLITLSRASNFAIEKIGVPAVNVLKDLKQETFYAPGSILKLELDNTQPLAYGMPRFTAIHYTNSPAFKLLLYTRESKAIGFYNEGSPLISGWLIGYEKIAGQTALAEIPVEKGRVIMFGFRVQNRAQTYGTFKLLFNAILTSNIEPVASLEIF